MGGNYFGGSGRQTTASSSYYWPKDDFCRPTTCPICGGSVFFIRHNGGSVWVDDLGIPWPKHPCFDDDDYQPVRRLSQQAHSLADARLGIVTEACRVSADNLQLQIACSTGGAVRLSTTASGQPQDFAGRLMLFSTTPPALHDSRLGKLPVVSMSAFGLSLVVPVIPAPPAKTAPGPRKALNRHKWREEDLPEWHRQIAEDAKEATSAIADPVQANKEAKRLALARIRGLKRSLRNRLLQHFEKTKWKELLRPVPANRPMSRLLDWRTRWRRPQGQK